MSSNIHFDLDFLQRLFREYFYAQRHWTKHLLHVPPGNLEIVGAIQKLNLSILHYNRTQEEIIAIQSWLKVNLDT